MKIIREPFYNYDGGIDCILEHEEYGDLPHTLDPEEDTELIESLEDIAECPQDIHDRHLRGDLTFQMMEKESQLTPRMIRESILSGDYTEIQRIEDEIQVLREQLNE